MRKRDTRAAVALAVALSGLLAGACARRVEVFDLVEGLPLADVRSDTVVVPLGMPEARWQLGSGWLHQVFDRRAGMSAIAASRATLRFRVSGSGAVVLRLNGRPLTGSDAVGRRLEVSVNGRVLGRKRVLRRAESYSFRAPEGALRSGDNELALTLQPPGANDSAEAIAWSTLEVLREETRQPDDPRRTAGGDGLILPAGTRIDYHLQLPEEATLDIAEIAFGAAGPGDLRVILEQDGEEPITLASFVEADRDVSVDLGPYGSSVVRLSLEAILPERLGSAGADVILTSPSIQVPERLSGAPTGAAPSGAAPARATGSGRGGNVLLYVVDALRADHLGIYGYERDVSPNLDRLAERATVFDSAISQSSWTRASMASVMTGLWPLAHDTNQRADVLAEEATTLAELLASQGYETFGIAQNPNVFARFGFAQGFERFRELWESSADDALAEIRGWLGKRDTDRPFFLWVHTIDPHTPYAAPGEYRTRYDDPSHGDLDLEKPLSKSRTARLEGEERERILDHIRARYDAEIYYADVVFGELLELFEERGLLDETLVIFVSDHGEEFLDHGKWEHGKDLHDSNLNIPLLIRAPGQETAGRVDALVQHVDLLPTILDFAGLEPLEGVEGRSLLPYLEAGVEETAPAVFSYLHLDGKPFASVVAGDWKLIERYPGDGLVVSQLFNLAEDPGETRSLTLEAPVRARYLALQIEARLAMGRKLTTSEAEMDEQTVNALRALGYLD